MDLDQIRQQIDDIDEQLLSLFAKRMQCSKAVADYKVAHDLPVLNRQREQQILDRVEAQAPAIASEARLLFSTIMDISRTAQYPTVNKNSPLRSLIRDGFSRQFQPESIACPGVNGSYSQLAASQLFPNQPLRFFNTFDQVFQAVKTGQCSCGIVPIENSYAGSVVENYDSLQQYEMYINHAVNIPISHCLVAPKGAKLENIRQVYSHKQALDQCSDYITQHSFQSVTADNTALAAQYVAQQSDPSCAAIASRQTAALYDLQILDENIQSSGANSTRFVVISNTLCIQPEANCISLAFSLPHVSGSLYCVLSKLAAFGLNLTKIESRPLKSSPFEYLFYLDFIGHLQDEKIVSLLCGMRDELPYFKLFGNYVLDE